MELMDDRMKKQDLEEAKNRNGRMSCHESIAN